MIEFNVGKYRAVIDEKRGGQMSQLIFAGRQILVGNSFWMSAAPEGARDGSRLGYEMSQSDITVIQEQGPNYIAIEGRLCRSNGSGQFYGHRYKRTYKFFNTFIEVDHNCWVSAEDMEEARKRWNNAPASFYVWNMPVDVTESMNHFRWNANRGWIYKRPTGEQWQEDNPAPIWGGIPQPVGTGESGENNGWHSIPVPGYMGIPPEMIIYEQKGLALKRLFYDVRNLVQVGFWYNPIDTHSRTIDVAVIGGDRKNITTGWPYLTPLNGGEVFRFNERLYPGWCDDVGRFTGL